MLLKVAAEGCILDGKGWIVNVYKYLMFMSEMVKLFHERKYSLKRYM